MEPWVRDRAETGRPAGGFPECNRDATATGGIERADIERLACAVEPQRRTADGGVRQAFEDNGGGLSAGGGSGDDGAAREKQRSGDESKRGRHRVLSLIAPARFVRRRVEERTTARGDSPQRGLELVSQRPARRRQDASLREPWPTGRKNRAPLDALSLRGGQGCRDIRARRSSVLGNATRAGVFRQTAARIAMPMTILFMA